jgi:hypothetical protein
MIGKTDEPLPIDLTGEPLPRLFELLAKAAAPGEEVEFRVEANDSAGWRRVPNCRQRAYRVHDEVRRCKISAQSTL